MIGMKKVFLTITITRIIITYTWTMFSMAFDVRVTHFIKRPLEIKYVYMYMYLLNVF